MKGVVDEHLLAQVISKYVQLKVVDYTSPNQEPTGTHIKSSIPGSEQAQAAFGHCTQCCRVDAKMRVFSVVCWFMRFAKELLSDRGTVFSSCQSALFKLHCWLDRVSIELQSFRF